MLHADRFRRTAKSEESVMFDSALPQVLAGSLAGAAENEGMFLIHTLPKLINKCHYNCI